MLFDKFFDLLNIVVDFLLNTLDLLPSMPVGLVNILDEFLNLILGGVSLFFLFVPSNVFFIVLPLFFAVHNAQNIYNIVLFILKKIPFLSIK